MLFSEIPTALSSESFIKFNLIIALEEALQSFNEIKAIVMNKNYDYLDQRNTEFEKDFKKFMKQMDKLKKGIGEDIEKNFDSVWETPQGIRFLTRFEKVKIYIHSILFYFVLNLR